VAGPIIRGASLNVQVAIVAALEALLIPTVLLPVDKDIASTSWAAL